MSTEAWALAGVVIGSMLGGLAQLLNDTLRGRPEDRTRTADIRRDVYSRFIAACA